MEKSTKKDIVCPCVCVFFAAVAGLALIENKTHPLLLFGMPDIHS